MFDDVSDAVSGAYGRFKAEYQAHHQMQAALAEGHAAIAAEEASVAAEEAAVAAEEAAVVLNETFITEMIDAALASSRHGDAEALNEFLNGNKYLPAKLRAELQQKHERHEVVRLEAEEAQRVNEKREAEIARERQKIATWRDAVIKLNRFGIKCLGFLAIVTFGWCAQFFVGIDSHPAAAWLALFVVLVTMFMTGKACKARTAKLEACYAKRADDRSAELRATFR